MNNQSLRPSFSSWAWRRLFARLVPALIAALVVAAWASKAEAACYTAFVHGKRDGTPTAAQAEAYWNPEPGTTAYRFDWWAAGTLGCKTTLIRYDGRQAFTTAASTVGSRLASFISSNSIPAGQLLIVTHSMGGLVVRYGLNNASSLVNWPAVRTATKYVINSQAPHVGSKGADVVAFEAGDGLWGDAVAILALLSQDRNAASDGMRRTDMEYASTSGGFMNDAVRTKKLYTIEGFRTGQFIGGPSVFETGGINTELLDTAWGAMCYKPHNINFLLCGITPGDGLVEQQSAAGFFTRSGTWDGIRPRRDGFTYFEDFFGSSLALCKINSTNSSKCRQWGVANKAMQGPHVRWLKYGGDHQQGSWDFWKTTLTNYLKAKTTQEYLGSYIGVNGHNLTP
jgi:triacylglycerol esterase/lipase EstA (alpha/beta hydrolase family)